MKNISQVKLQLDMITLMYLKTHNIDLYFWQDCLKFILKCKNKYDVTNELDKILIANTGSQEDKMWLNAINWYLTD